MRVHPRNVGYECGRAAGDSFGHKKLAERRFKRFEKDIEEVT